MVLNKVKPLAPSAARTNQCLRTTGQSSLIVRQPIGSRIATASTQRRKTSVIGET